MGLLDFFTKNKDKKTVTDHLNDIDKMLGSNGFKIGINCAQQCFEGMRNGQFIVTTQIIEDIRKACDSESESTEALDSFFDKMTEYGDQKLVKSSSVSYSGLDVNIFYHSGIPTEDLHKRLKEYYGDINFSITEIGFK